MNLGEILLKDGDVVPFVWMTKEYGRASFDFCPIYKRENLVELFIYPRQQENIDYYYKWSGHPKTTLHVQSYQKLEDPKIWQMRWCKEHKTQTFQAYAPKFSNFIWFSVFSDNITIGFLETNFTK